MTETTRLEPLIDQWLNSFTRNSRYTYQKAVDRFRQTLNDKPLDQVTPEDIQRFNRELEADTILSPNTIRSLKVGIRSLLKFAYQQNLLSENLSKFLPVKGHQVPREADLYVDFRRDEVIRLEPDSRNRVILWLTVVLGCTINEVVALTWLNVSEEQGSITLYDHRNLPRTIFLIDPIWAELLQLRQGQAQKTPNEHVFQGSKQTRLDYAQIHQIIADALDRAGVSATPGEVCFGSSREKRRYLLL